MVTRAAKFRLQNEFRNELFNGKKYKSNWQIPTTYFAKAEELMAQVTPDLLEPPFGPPTKRYLIPGGPVSPPPAVVRNMSDPVINGDLPAKQYHLNEQTTWAVGYYTAYGKYTSLNSALATWAITAGLTVPA